MASLALEALAAAAPDSVQPYPFTIAKNTADCWEIDPAPLWYALLHDLQNGTQRATIAARFHQGLIRVIVELAQRLCAEYPDIQAVALSGGVFQNTLLFNGINQQLTDAGVRVLTHQHVPTNDGGIALGQAVIGAAQLATTSADCLS